MLKKFFRAIFSPPNVLPEGGPDDEGGFWVCSVRAPDGMQDLIVLQEPRFEHGLPAEAIVGGLKRLVADGGKPTADNFRPNRAFINVLHDVIAKYGPSDPDLVREARRQKEGYVYVLDARTPTPAGRVPPHDIIGVFEIVNGTPGSYRPNPNHLLLSAQGIFRLPPSLHDRLIERLSTAQVQVSRVD